MALQTLCVTRSYACGVALICRVHCCLVPSCAISQKMVAGSGEATHSFRKQQEAVQRRLCIFLQPSVQRPHADKHRAYVDASTAMNMKRKGVRC